MVSAWVGFGIAIGSLVITGIAVPLYLRYRGRSERSIAQLQGDLNITVPKVKDAIDAFKKDHPDVHTIDELEKRMREAGNDFSGKLLGAAANDERAKKVYHEEYRHIISGILEEVNEMERVYSQESFFSARSQRQDDGEGIELQN